VVVIYIAQSFASSKLSKHRLYSRQLIHASLRTAFTWLNRAVYALFNAPPRLATDREGRKAEGRALEEFKIMLKGRVSLCLNASLYRN